VAALIGRRPYRHSARNPAVSLTTGSISAWLFTCHHRRRNHSNYARGRARHQILDDHRRNRAAWQRSPTGSIGHLDPRSGRS